MRKELEFSHLKRVFSNIYIVNQWSISYAHNLLRFLDVVIILFALIIDDRAHSNLERQEIIVEQSSESRLLYVVFSETGTCIRIISARKLTSAERRRYEKGKLD